MTTRIRISNEGPCRVKVTAHGNEPIDSTEPSAGPVVSIDPGAAADFLYVYGGRKFTVEEVPPGEE
jgi:hypothetical protein